MRPTSARAGVPLLTSIAYHWTSVWVPEILILCVAAMVLLNSPAFRMRVSISLIAVPSAFRGLTSPEEKLSAPGSDRGVVAKAAELDRTFVILVTLTWLPSSGLRISHIGSPGAESCIATGRYLLLPEMSLW